MMKSKSKEKKDKIDLEQYETCDLSWLDWKSISININK